MKEIHVGLGSLEIKMGVFVHKKKKNSDEVVKCGKSSGDQCLTKALLLLVSGSSESILSLSEPTDIKNWFSSYVYESSSLDASDGIGDSLNEQSKCKKDGVLVESSKRQNGEELRKLRIKRSVSKEAVGEKEQSRGLPICDSSWRVTKQARQPVSEVPGPLDCHHICQVCICYS
ncbi:uncharacterized protein LOC126795496 [Argentina anserina]|uniref:uncharacterized protein LOC126795496 n=1 Tax=Argentina anserina TaxID=57926 RepID=UPI00217636D1|nr:uncharacterized protein LOC126795496 [Potentilla anserina]